MAAHPRSSDMLECPHRCGEKFSHDQELGVHVGEAGACPRAPVQCPFRNVGQFGCHVTPQRRFQEAHLTRSSGLHQRLLLEELTQVKETQAELRRDIASVTSTGGSTSGGTVAVSEAGGSLGRQPAGTVCPPPAENCSNESRRAQLHSAGNGDMRQGRMTSAAPAAEREKPMSAVDHETNQQIRDLSAGVDLLKTQCSGVRRQLTIHSQHIQQLQTPRTSACAGCERLSSEMQLLRSAVLSMASQAEPCTKWSVQCEVRMSADGRLSLLSAASSPYYWSGPLECGHRIYTSTELRTITQLGGPRLAPNQVGSLVLSVNMIGSRESWPSAAQTLRVSFPNTLTSSTARCVVSLPSARRADGERRTVRAVQIPILLPADAELGATMDWSYQTELCVFWANSDQE